MAFVGISAYARYTYEKFLAALLLVFSSFVFLKNYRQHTRYVCMGDENSHDRGEKGWQYDICTDYDNK